MLLIQEKWNKSTVSLCTVLHQASLRFEAKPIPASFFFMLLSKEKKNIQEIQQALINIHPNEESNQTTCRCSDIKESNWTNFSSKAYYFFKKLKGTSTEEVVIFCVKDNELTSARLHRSFCVKHSGVWVCNSMLLLDMNFNGGRGREGERPYKSPPSTSVYLRMLEDAQ